MNLGDNAGAKELKLRDSDSTEVFTVNSNGDAQIKGTLQVKQTADSVGFRIYGYDDMSAINGEFAINSSGTFVASVSDNKNMLFSTGGGIYFRGGSTINFQDNNRATLITMVQKLAFLVKPLLHNSRMYQYQTHQQKQK